MSESVVRRAYVQVDGGLQMHYRVAGSGERCILLLHHTASSSAMYEQVIGRLADRGHLVLALDLLGHGMSDPLPERPEIEDYGDVARSVVHRATGFSTYSVFGHHLGASVALYLAATYPEEVQAGIGSALSRVAPDYASELATEAWGEWDRDGAEIVRWWRQRWSIGHRDMTPSIAARCCADMMLANGRQADGHRAVGRCDHDQLLKALKVPFLCTGGRLDRMYAYSVLSAELSDYACPGDLGDGAVYIADRDPDGWVAKVEEFLSVIAPRIAASHSDA